MAKESGKNLGLAADRIYTSYEEMAAKEAARPDGIEAVSIVTPNHVHAGPAKAFLEAGIHVICDKPLTHTLAAARELAAVKPKNGAKFLLTHNYTGYPLVRQARELVKSGALGKIRVVQAEYPQDWLTLPADPGNKQAAWRTDPKRSGAGGAIGDIGTHAYNLAALRHRPQDRRRSAPTSSPSSRAARSTTTSTSCSASQGGARGMLWASQVAPGNENGLQLRVYGDKAGLEWRQDNPELDVVHRARQAASSC